MNCRRRMSRKRASMPACGAGTLTLIAAALLCGAALSPANAQQTGAPQPAPPTQADVTEEIIRRLQRHNAISKEDAEDLLHMLQASQQAAPAAQAAGSPAAQAAAANAPATPPVEKKGDVRIMYIPEAQKQILSQEIEQKVLATTQAQNWARPDALPSWISRISFDGDFRFRYDWDWYDSNNFPFINYQAINSGNPYDVNLSNPNNGNGGHIPPPFLNTTEDRQLPRIRARIGMLAKVADDVTAGFRFNTGNNTNPVSTDQTLGTDFNKTTFVIDQAYMNYRPAHEWSLWAGRMPSPWFSPTQLVWDSDLNFDGIAVQFIGAPLAGVAPFATVGAFSVENSAYDFPSTSSSKIGSRDKWLYGAQIGAAWKLRDDLAGKAAVAYYDFSHIAGKESSPCAVFTTSDFCDTDNSRPGFVQKGNTMFALRNLIADPNNPNGPQYQYFGLASPFRELDVNTSLDWGLHGPIHLMLDAEYVYNLAFDRRSVLAKGPTNNFGPGPDASTNGPYEGGQRGFLVQMLGGYPNVAERWQWNVSGGYRRLESDAAVDAFTDSDFHFGGTNAKGYHLQGSLGFARNAWISARYFSATEVSGPPLSIDTLQLDLNGRF